MKMPTAFQTDEFSAWLKGLRDVRAKAKILTRIERLENGNPGDVEPIGQGLSEMKIDYGPATGFTSSSPVTRSRSFSAAIKQASRATSTRRRQLSKFDAADYLDSPEMITAYLNEALETGDSRYIAQAIGTIARGKGMSAIAKESGLSRGNLYRALSENGTPEFGTIMKVLDAIDIQLEAKQKTPAA
jgi:probable addiction module antidote protein